MMLTGRAGKTWDELSCTGFS